MWSPHLHWLHWPHYRNHPALSLWMPRPHLWMLHPPKNLLSLHFWSILPTYLQTWWSQPCSWNTSMLQVDVQKPLCRHFTQHLNQEANTTCIMYTPPHHEFHWSYLLYRNWLTKYILPQYILSPLLITLGHSTKQITFPPTSAVCCRHCSWQIVDKPIIELIVQGHGRSPITIRVKHGDLRHMNLWIKSASVCSFWHILWHR